MYIIRDDSKSISESKLKGALQGLYKKGMFPYVFNELFRRIEGGIIPLHIRAQNAGVIIRKTGNDVCFETFEVSFCNESVITARGRFRRLFPSSYIVVLQSTFDEDGF